MLQRIVLYAVLGYLLDSLGHGFSSWEFWCVLALFWASELITRREGYEEGMVFIATLSDEHLAQVRREVAEIEKETDGR